MAKPIPAHQRPENCFVCGYPPHEDHTAKGGHKFWSNADARAEAREHDRRVTVPGPEARYVATYRPY